MYHGVSAGTQPGNTTVFEAKRLRELLDSIDADEQRIASIVEQRSKLTEAQIRAFFREAHTMNAAEAGGVPSGSATPPLDRTRSPPG
jgi:hypothetical protein